MKPGDVQYTALPLYHSFSSMFGIAGGFIAGATLAVTPKFSASNFWKECYETNAKYIHYIGEMMRYVLETPPGPYDKKHNVQVKLKKILISTCPRISGALALHMVLLKLGLKPPVNSRKFALIISIPIFYF
jgi:acyl-CoA synthetase (AMP-forming)/AMP-acid ligase II